jgi:hypothetical protein
VFFSWQVIGLWVLFALPVWSAAYKQAGCDTPEWFGISQVAEDAPGIGLIAKAAPVYDGPTFREVQVCLTSLLCVRACTSGRLPVHAQAAGQKGAHGTTASGALTD